MEKIILVFTFLTFQVFSFAQNSPNKRTGEINYEKDAIHPLQRNDVFPGNGSTVSLNPPSFMWPAVYEDNIEFRNISGAIYPSRKHDVNYTFRLSKDANFSESSIISVDEEWAFYNNHNALKPGKWYWQYGWSIEGNDYNWSKVFSFTLNENSRIYETPSFSELFSLIPKSHPRILSTKESVNSIQNNYSNNSSKMDSLLAPANRALKNAIPVELDALRPIEVRNNKGLSERGLQVAYREASKTLAKNMSKAIQALTKAYVLTGDLKYGKAAINWAMRTSTFEPHGPACQAHFADSRHMRNMAWVYDSCYELLSNNEKTQLLTAIKIRLEKYHNEWVNGLENITNSGHVWQQLHYYQIQTCIAILRDVPEAKQWLEYAYEVFIAKAPALSSPLDGAWANGASYMSANQLSILNTSLILKNITGKNFLKNPWFSNNAWYMVHGRPVGAPMSGFGDSHEKYSGIPHETSVQYMDFLSRTNQIKHAAWYVEEAKKQKGNKLKENELGFIASNPLLDWYMTILNINRGPKLSKEYKIPEAHAFRDVGIVAMHSDIMNVEKDNVLHFKSGPYGSVSNHAHSSNNAFNIAVNGKRVLFPIGYRNLTNYSSTDTHNSILIDGKGQVRGGVGYGWIPRYVHGNKITYTVGDASNAYGGKLNLLQKFEKPDSPNEIQSGLERFRRHIVMLRPRIFVVYDDLIAYHKAEWSWLLHSDKIMKIESNSVYVDLDETRTKASVFASSPLATKVDFYTPKATEDYKVNTKGKKLPALTDQYSFTAKNIQKEKKLRIVSIITVNNKGEQLYEIKNVSNGKWEVGEWIIRAEMNPEKPADLLIVNKDKSAGISTGFSDLILNDMTYLRKKSGSTILIEKINGKVISKEVVDTLPEAAR